MEEDQNMVNWTDGMIIQSSQLRATEDYFIQQDSLNRQLMVNETNFGLFSIPGDQEDFRFDMTLEEHYLVISGLRCTALTRGGMLVRLDTDTYSGDMVDPESAIGRIRVPNPEHQDLFDLILSVEPSRRTDFGTVDPDEYPIRRPWSRLKMNLSLSPAGPGATPLSGEHFFTLARIRIRNGKAIQDQEYIPPVYSIKSHPELLRNFEKMRNDLKEALENFMKYVKMNPDVSGKKAVLPFQNFMIFTPYLSSELEFNCPEKSPYYLVNVIRQVAFMCAIHLKVFGTPKELYKVLRIDSDQWMDTVNTMVNYKYNHLLISDALRIVKSFSEVLKNIGEDLVETKQVVKKGKEYDLKA